jgi:DNA-binding NarL/FixJ family response regulator
VWHHTVDPAEAWHALMHGGWTVAEHVVGQSANTLVALFASTPGEREAVLAEELRVAVDRARGTSIKVLSSETGRTYGAVAQCIAGVMRKLRLCSKAQLVALLNEPSLTATRIRREGSDYLIVTYTAPRWSPPPCLSKTEQSIVLDLVAGASNQVIARRRGTSPRTVANQVASIFGKLNVHSRMELFVALRSYSDRRSQTRVSEQARPLSA